MIKTASQIADEVLAKCAAAADAGDYAKSTGTGVLRGAGIGAGAGLALSSIPLIKSLSKGGRGLTAEDLKMMGVLTGLTSGVGGVVGAGSGLTGEGISEMARGNVNPTSVGTAAGGAAGGLGGLAHMLRGMRGARGVTPLIAAPVALAGAGGGALGGGILGHGVGKAIEKIRE